MTYCLAKLRPKYSDLDFTQVFFYFYYLSETLLQLSLLPPAVETEQRRNGNRNNVESLITQRSMSL